MTSWESMLDSNEALAKFGDNAIGLLALALRFRIDDIESAAADCLTDGSDDKKCDIVFLDPDDEVAVVAQCYRSTRPKNAAPSNKASDLNTAVSWLLQRDLPDLPERLRPAATGLREAISAGKIRELHVWYVHNLPGSANVLEELKTVESTAESALKSNFGSTKVRVSASEVCRDRLEQMYRETQSPILVSEHIDFRIPAGFEVQGKKWHAFVTTVSARQLRTLYRKHKTALFSANIRDYLGARSSDANINNGIRNTAEHEPENFWAFNNGVTALVHNYHLSTTDPRTLQVHGLSIVNGAQTTGAIGSLKTAPEESATIPIRFIKTSSVEIVQAVVQYNNSQNKVTASDFRSTDRIQNRIRDEMASLPQAEYQGGRRGGHADVIKRRPNLMPSYTVGQALAALHGDPATAYNKKSEIWASDNLYSKYSNDNTTATHIVFAYSLIRAIEARKRSLLDRSSSGSDLKATEERELAFYRQRGAIYVCASAIATGLETFVRKRITNMFRVSFGPRVSPGRAEKIWEPVVLAIAPLTSQLMPVVEQSMSSDSLKRSLEVFSSLVAATADSNEKIYSAFRNAIVIA